MKTPGRSSLFHAPGFILSHSFTAEHTLGSPTAELSLFADLFRLDEFFRHHVIDVSPPGQSLFHPLLPPHPHPPCEIPLCPSQPLLSLAFFHPMKILRLPIQDVRVSMKWGRRSPAPRDRTSGLSNDYSFSFFQE